MTASARLANAQDSAVNQNTNFVSGNSLEPLLTAGLNELHSNHKLHVSWIRYTLYALNAAGRKSTDKADWIGSLDNYTVAYTNIMVEDKKPTNENVQVYGRNNNTYWSTSEKGMVDIDNIKTNLTVQLSRCAYVLGELTNIVSLGFGIHWDVNSIKINSNGKVRGKSKDLNDDLEGVIEFSPDGKMTDCFYKVPHLQRQYLLSYSYEDSRAGVLSNLATISLSLTVPSLSPQYKYIKAQELIKYVILDDSIVSSNSYNVALIGVPPKELYKYAIISNGITLPTERILQPEMLRDSQPKVVEKKSALGLTKRQLIIAGFVLVNLATLLFLLRFTKKGRL